MSYANQQEYINQLAAYIRETIKHKHIKEIREELLANGHKQEAVDKAILEA